MSSAVYHHLLTPSSVALIGASENADKASSRPLNFLRDHHYAGRVYPVNPRHGTVAGERAWRSLRELPEVPDHAFVMVSTDAVFDAVQECAAVGVPMATILAGGFGEAGPAGRARQQAVHEVAAAGGVRLLGPNSLGVVNLRNNLRLTGNAVFAEPDLPRGGTFVASQSGSMIGSLVSRGAAAGLGFAAVVSVGAEMDLNLGEICDAAIDDPTVTGFLLFLETIRHAGAFARFARRAADHAKPVLAYRVGRSAAAAELAVTHTGTLAGEHDIATEFLAECGIAQAHSLDGLVAGLPVLDRIGYRSGDRGRVGVLTTTGGGAAMVVDELSLRGVEVTSPSRQTHARLTDAGVHVGHSRIVDVTLAGTRYEVMRAAIEVMTSAPEFDLVVVVIGSSARSRPDLAVAPILDQAATVGNLVAFLVPDAPAAAQMLTAARIPTFCSPVVCGDAVAAALSRRIPRSRVTPVPPSSGPVATLDEAQGYQVLNRVGVPVGPYTVLDTASSTTPPELPAAIGYPVAVKLLDASVTHKSDAGGVVLGVGNAQDLATAVAGIAASIAAAHPHKVVDRVLVQPMAAGVGEVLIGYRLDHQVGPVVVLAAGGTLTELYRDRAIGLAPLDTAAADRMLGEVIAIHALRGYRGTPPADLDALRAALIALSTLANDPTIVEAEVNPLILFEDGAGAVAVDAVVRVRRSESAPETGAIVAAGNGSR